MLLFCANEKGVIVLKLCTAKNYRILHADNFLFNIDVIALAVKNDKVTNLSSLIIFLKLGSGIYDQNLHTPRHKIRDKDNLGD